MKRVLMMTVMLGGLFVPVWAVPLVDGSLVCAPETPYVVSKGQGTVNLSGQEPCIMPAVELPIDIFSMQPLPTSTPGIPPLPWESGGTGGGGTGGGGTGGGGTGGGGTGGGGTGGGGTGGGGTGGGGTGGGGTGGGGTGGGGTGGGGTGTGPQPGPIKTPEISPGIDKEPRPPGYLDGYPERRGDYIGRGSAGGEDSCSGVVVTTYLGGQISAMAGCDSDSRGAMGRGVRSPKPENTTPVKPPRIDGPDLAAYIAQFALNKNKVPRFFKREVTYDGDTRSFDAYNFNVKFSTLIPNILITKDGMPSWFELSIRVNYGNEFGNASGNYIIVTVTYKDHNGILRTEHASAHIDGLDYEKANLDWDKMKISYVDTSVSIFAKALSQNKDIESFIKNVIDDHHRHVKPRII